MLSDAQREKLAARLRKGRSAAAAGVPRRAPGGDVPLSFGQEQLWFIDQFSPGLATYNVAGAVRLRGDLDADALGRALDGLRERHEVLRTRLVTGPDGRPAQVVDDPVPVPLAVEQVPADRLRELAVAEGSRPFSLADGPLFRARLFRPGAGEHLLVVVAHHAVFDGWSFDILLRELSALYEAEATGVAATLPPLPIQFADYAAWERDRLQGDTLAGLVKYWREALDGAQTLELPTDRPRPLLESHRGAAVRRLMDREILDGLRELSRQQGTTLFVVLLAALQVLLHRYSGQDDIVVGTPSANRARPELTPLIGYLVNTLPIRARMSGDPTFVELLDQVRGTVVAASAHQDLPFAKLISALDVARDPSRTPVFQVSFGTGDGAGPGVSAAGVEMEITADYAEPDTAKFDLSFFVGSTPEEFVVVGQYATDVFDESTVLRMLRHFEVLLAGIVADPGRRLSALPLLSPEDLRREIVEWNDTAVEFPVVCVHSRFEDQVRETPDGIAAVHGEESVTYAELNAAANRMARFLRERGAGPEVLVGVCLPPSIRRLAVVLGIMKAGSGYVPLDPALPVERLSFMVADAGMPVVVADAGGPELSGDAEVVSVDAVVSGLSGDDLEVGVEPSNVAYVIYTSGSTGQPKGVVVEHRQVVNFALGLIGHWQVGPGDRVLQFASLSFDASVQDMFVSLLSGATAVLADQDTRMSPPRLTKLVRRERVTVACLPPAVANLLADERFPDLRALMTAGEELPAALMRRWLRPELRLCNGYGPTETAVTATFAELDGTIEPPPIGGPAPNYQAYVLDAHLNPVPVGVIGELHLGGAGVTRGYLNRPELTAQRFIDDPFRPGGRLYRTGDLVRRRPDGLMQFVGRIDDQVKLRGLRVETGEIETALTSHPGVAQAVVTVTPDAAGDKQLVGYVRVVSPTGPDELRRHVAQWLPDYMVPARIVVVDAFPLNSSGKIHKAALPAPGAVEQVATYQAPATLTETVLVGLYSALLNRERVGVDDSFFDVGGHSLQAMQLVTRIKGDLGVDIGVTAVFLAPTPRRLAARIEAIRAGTARPASSSLLVELTDGGEPFFLVHALGGTVYVYAPLARELPFAVYGIEAAGLNAGPAASSLDDMVERYVQEIRAVQPHGPYRLGGWSMGGIVAYELTRRLESLGEEVSLLALLDPPFRLPSETPTDLASEFVADAARTLGWVAAPAEWQSDPLGWLAGRLSSGAADADSVRTAIDRRFEVFQAHRRLLAGYSPRAGVAAGVVLVHAAASPNLAGQPLWLEILGSADAATIDGDHYTFLQPPGVRAVAELIAERQSPVPPLQRV